MIQGIGNDVVNIERIARLVDIYGELFLKRIYTEYEQKAALSYKDARQRAGFFAKRFAAKEACAKALGTGFRDGLRFTDIEVQNAGNGKPELVLYGKARQRAGEFKAFLSLSDDYPMAVAMVVFGS